MFKNWAAVQDEYGLAFGANRSDTARDFFMRTGMWPEEAELEFPPEPQRTVVFRDRIALESRNEWDHELVGHEREDW